MKLFVDDERPVPDHTWVLAQRSADAIAILEACRLADHAVDSPGVAAVEVLSLDHDLSTTMMEDDTSRPIVLWMCENSFWPESIYVHTGNPVGEEWLVGMIKRYAPPGTLKGYGINYWGSCKIDSIERHAP